MNVGRQRSGVGRDPAPVFEAVTLRDVENESIDLLQARCPDSGEIPVKGRAGPRLPGPEPAERPIGLVRRDLGGEILVAEALSLLDDLRPEDLLG